MTGPHLWMRAEQRANERRAGLTPEGAAQLRAAGFRITVECSDTRIMADADYAAQGCRMAPGGSWPDAPDDAIIFGLKELPDTGTALRHRHIMFGHAFKGQGAGRVLLDRFKAGGGALLDLEYLTDAPGRRLAAFGYWAGYAGAAVSLLCLAAQQKGLAAPSVSPFDSATAMATAVRAALSVPARAPLTAIIIGAKGRVGTGATDLCHAADVAVTGWDMAETAHGGPFPEILKHDLFFNCVLAGPGTPVFVPLSAKTTDRSLKVIGDIACDPDSDYNPIPLYDAATTWEAPAKRVHEAPPLDVMAIDNLPSLLPKESSEDFAQQLLPVLMSLKDDAQGIWHRAKQTYLQHL